MKTERGAVRAGFMMFFLFALIMLICLSGCGKKEEPEEDTTMGRYLEERLELPEGTRWVYDVAVMEDDELWIAAITDEWYIFTSKDNGKNWEKSSSVMKMIDPERKNEKLNIHKIFIGPNKELVVNTMDFSDYEKTGDSISCLWYIDSSGKVKPIDLSEQYYGDKIAFDKDGNLLVPVSQKCIHISKETGEVINIYEEEDKYGAQVCGNTLIIFYSMSKILYYDLQTGKPIEDDSVLSSQLSKSLFWTGEPPVLFIEDEQGKMFFCNKDGIYSHVFGGTVVEQVVDASLCSLGVVSSGYIGFTKNSGNDFYVAKIIEENGNNTSCLYRYYYDRNMPTVPEEELRVYTLDTCPELEQAALFYQIKHPEVHVVIETGIEEAKNSAPSDGYMDSRRVDTVKNLNTEILAGKGPDIVVLDNLPVNAYIEKGILEDLSEILKKDNTADEILPNILEAFRQKDGKLYQIPARVRIPVLMGQKSLLETGAGMSGIKDMAKEAKNNLSETQSIFPYFMEGDLADVFITACSYDWKKEDGTLDEEKLRKFMEEIGEIYNSDKQDKLRDMGSAGGNKTFEEGIGLGVFQVFYEGAKLTFGEVCSPGQIELLEGIAKDEPQLDWEILEEGSYRPWMTLGISTKCSNRERAEEFLLYLMSEESQKIQQGNGFSIRKDVVQSKQYWGIDDEIPADSPKNVMGIQLPTGGSKDIYFYNLTDEQLENMYTILSELDKPYSLDIEVKSLIKEATRNYLLKKVTLDEAIKNLIDKINLYLSE